MELNTKVGVLAKLKTHCLILPVLAKGKLPASTAEIDKLSGGKISAVIKSGDITGDNGSQLMLHGLSNVEAQRIMLVGCGQPKKITEKKLANALAEAVKTLQEGGTTDAVSTLHQVGERDLHATVLQSGTQAVISVYRFDQYKSHPTAPKKPLKTLTFHAVDKSQQNKLSKALSAATAIATGMGLTRDLANMPPNDCHPTHLADQAKSIGKTYKSVKTTVLNEAQMKKLGMGALLSVSAGSEQPGVLISMEYQGSKKSSDKPVVLVGKGVTFDTGGISIKPSAKMDEMKYDMCGAATVFGVIKACAEMNLPINVVGVVPAVENMPDGRATRPGDIVTASNGKTIEILNTDAEGRLILCDALTYAEKFKPACVIDIATLTGACIVALGHHTSGLMANNDKLASELTQAGLDSGDACWRLPLGDEYNKQLDSPFADLANIGGPSAGTITAGCFLSQFTENYQWAHLDIAGTAWSSTSKAATARPVPMLMQFLMQRSK